MPKTIPSADGYRGQYLVSVKRKTVTAWYFKPKADQIPAGWLNRYGKAVRVPRLSAQRVGGEVERSHALIDAATLFAEFNRMRSAPAQGGEWPHGTLRWLINSWRASTWFTDELADDTRRSYDSCLKQITDWADRVAARHNGIHPSVQRLTTKGVKAFLDEYADRPTRQRHLKATLSNLMTHAIQIGELEKNPVTDVRLTRRKRGQARKRPVVLWDQAFVDASISITEARDIPEIGAWIALMWDIGRRPTDINALKVLDDITRVRLERGEITSGMYYDPVAKEVRGWQSKTKRFGSIPLDPVTIEIIERVRPRPEAGANQSHVFIDSRFGEPFTLERFAYQFRQIAQAAGLSATTPQMGRHSCIMRCYRANMNDDEVRNITDHSDPATIKRKYWVQDESRATSGKAKRAAAENGG